MFKGCSSLESLNIPNLVTSKVTRTYDMFSGCSSLTSLDVSGWKTSGVYNMNSMFNGCSSLTSLDVSGWNTSSAQNIASMFNGCSSLTSLDVSEWNTSRAETAIRMFSGCSSLTSLDVSKWDTSNVSYIYDMFSGCSSLTSLDVSGWDTSRAYNMNRLFQNCSSISKIDLSNFDTTHCPYMKDIFSGMSSLDEIALGNLFSFNGNGAATECELPTPSGNGLTGLWYDADADEAYSSSDIPNKHAATYVAQRSIDKSMFFVDQNDTVYTGLEIEKLASGKNPLTDSDYQVSYENNRNVGTATIKIAGKGKYSGELLYSFRILQADPAFEAPAGLTATYGQTLADLYRSFGHAC